VKDTCRIYAAEECLSNFPAFCDNGVRVMRAVEVDVLDRSICRWHCTHCHGVAEEFLVKIGLGGLLGTLRRQQWRAIRVSFEATVLASEPCSQTRQKVSLDLLVN